MRLLSTIFACIAWIGCVVKSEECTTGNNCHAQSSENVVLPQIKTWWQEMSIQKPLNKCTLPKKWIIDSPILKMFSHHVPVKSFPCSAEDVPIPFSFKGNIKDGRLDGLGKLKLGPKILTDDYNTCLKVGRILGQDIVEVIGTFVNGVLHGNAKFILGDGKVVIANYANGLAYGLRRDWDVNGTLTSVSFSYQGGKVGKSWQLIGKSLVYSDVATLNRSDDLAFVIPFKTDSTNTQILAGKFWNHIMVLNEVQKVKTMKATMDEGGCNLNLSIEPGEYILSSFYDVQWDKFIEKFHDHKSAQNCQDFERMDSSTPQKLEKWYEEANLGTHSKNYYQLALQMRQESEAPSSGPLVISEISFKNDKSEDSQWSPNEMTVTFFEKQQSNVTALLVSFDDQLRLHGVVELQGGNLLEMNHKFGFEFTNVTVFRGMFNHGILEGPAQFHLRDGRTVLVMVHSGILHGPAVYIGSVPILPSRLTRPLITFSLFETDLSFLGRYKNGKPNGNFWLRMIGGGFMHGKFNDDGSATGDNMSFIYPDMETALVGKFEDFVMKRAHEANVLDAKCDQDGLVIISKFANLSGPVFYYEAPTNESYGAGPYGINDPYERKSVQITESSIPQSGEGVFAIRSFPAKRCSCYCSGFLYNYGSEMEGYLASCTNNETLSMDERRACKKYSVGMNFFNTVIDIPPEMDKPGMFQPTVGPKVNHSFRDSNSAYVEVEHPRWGSINCVRAERPIKAGEELFTFYFYQPWDPPSDFPWYFEQKRKIEAEEEEMRKKAEGNVVEKKKKTVKKKKKSQK